MCHIGSEHFSNIAFICKTCQVTSGNQSQLFAAKMLTIFFACWTPGIRTLKSLGYSCSLKLIRNLVIMMQAFHLWQLDHLE